jgi:hypothetical protein
MCPERNTLLPIVPPVATVAFMAAETPEGRAESDWCVRCGDTGIVLVTYCPRCGALPLCVDCIVAHIAEICEQNGRTLGP